MAKSDDEGPDYEVGYGRPPKGTRFRKGQSGNPKGRPREGRSITASLKRELASRITVREGGTERKITKSDAIAKRYVALALGGNPRAMSQLLLFDQSETERDETASLDRQDSRSIDPIDIEILRHHFFPKDGGDESPAAPGGREEKNG